MSAYEPPEEMLDIYRWVQMTAWRIVQADHMDRRYDLRGCPCYACWLENLEAYRYYWLEAVKSQALGDYDAVKIMHMLMWFARDAAMNSFEAGIEGATGAEFSCACWNYRDLIEGRDDGQQLNAFSL